MKNKLFVGNIPYQAQEEDIKAVFRRVGLVSSVILIKDRRKQSIGYGFVEMSNQAEAADAIEKLNGYTLKVEGASRNLYVREANGK